jgi:hypothetical protein
MRRWMVLAICGLSAVLTGCSTAATLKVDATSPRQHLRIISARRD